MFIIIAIILKATGLIGWGWFWFLFFVEACGYVGSHDEI